MQAAHDRGMRLLYFCGKPEIFDGFGLPFLAAHYLQETMPSMPCLNNTTQEFSTPFQIAAHMEIPGLPRVTHPALAAKQTASGKNKNIQKPEGKTASFRIFRKLSEFDLWLAALSL